MKYLLAPLLASALLLAGCSGGGGSSTATSATGTLSLEVTDAPIDYSLVEEATIWVGTVRVKPDANEGGGFLTIYDDDPVELDLMSMRNGLRRALALAELPVGGYGQIRLIVTRAYLRLTNGAEYDSDDGTIHLTSQDTSGFKVFIEPSVEIVGGLTSSLLLDVDLTKTFKPVPANDPLNASTYHLHPVIRVANLSTTGDIRGLVQVDDGSGGLIGAGGVTVYILPPDGTTDDGLATTATEENGAYAVLGLEPGSYDVFAQRDGFSGRVNEQLVTVGNGTLVDVVISE